MVSCVSDVKAGTLEAGTVPEKAIISHRGEKYEIGRGKRFYGIWVVGAPYAAPVDRWPETRDGWGQAWMRFTAIEVPGTITTVRPQRTGLRSLLNQRRSGPAAGQAEAGQAEAGQAGTDQASTSTDQTGTDQAAADGPASETAASEAAASETTAFATATSVIAASARRRGGTALLVGEGLLVLGVVLGLAGLFPAYAGGQSLISQNDQVVPHLAYVIAWAAAAGMIALSVSRPRAARLGALFALGLSAVTFGLFLTDLGEVTSHNSSLGVGLVVSLLGWLACTVGAALALLASCRDADPARAEQGWPARPTRGHAGPLALLALAGIGTAAAFAPSWDSYTLTQSSTGTAATYLEGNAFSNPGVMIAGSVAVMVAVVVVAALAALWRPARQGALLLAGAVVPFAAQAISALIQIRQPAYAMFGITKAQATAEGVAITSGMAPIFWVFCVFVIALLISCAWLVTAPRQPAIPVIGAIHAIPKPPWMPYPGGHEGLLAGEPAGGEHAEPEESGDAADVDVTDNDGGAEDGEHSAYA
jgi:hypothetical protein